MLDVGNSHLYDLSLLDPALALLQVVLWDQLTKVSQAVVHTVPTPLLDDTMRHWVLETKGEMSKTYFYDDDLPLLPLTQKTRSRML